MVIVSAAKHFRILFHTLYIIGFAPLQIRILYGASLRSINVYGQNVIVKEEIYCDGILPH